MSINIESPHLRLGKKLQGLVQKKFQQLEKIFDRIENMDVVLRKAREEHHSNYIVEAKLRVPGKILFAAEQEQSFEEALQKVVADLEHQIHRLKDELAASR